MWFKTFIYRFQGQTQGQNQVYGATGSDLDLLFPERIRHKTVGVSILWRFNKSLIKYLLQSFYPWSEGDVLIIYIYICILIFYTKSGKLKEKFPTAGLEPDIDIKTNNYGSNNIVWYDIPYKNIKMY